ncbi:MAG: hypothetical protein ACRD1T_26535 [Acidimicrobiia bacterium]
MNKARVLGPWFRTTMKWWYGSRYCGSPIAMLLMAASGTISSESAAAASSALPRREPRDRNLSAREVGIDRVGFLQPSRGGAGPAIARTQPDLEGAR